MKIGAAFETQLWYMLLARAIRDARLVDGCCENRRVESSCETSCRDQQVTRSSRPAFSRFLECDNRVRSYDVYIVERNADRCDDIEPYWRHLERGNEQCRRNRGHRGARRHRFDCNTTGSVLDLVA